MRSREKPHPKESWQLTALLRPMFAQAVSRGALITTALPLIRRIAEADHIAMFWADDTGVVQVYLEPFPVQIDAPSSHKAPMPGMAIEAQVVGLRSEVARLTGAQCTLNEFVNVGGEATEISLFHLKEPPATFGARERAGVRGCLTLLGTCASRNVDLGGAHPADDELAEQDLLVVRSDGTLVHASELGMRLAHLARNGRLFPDALRDGAYDVTDLMSGVDSGSETWIHNRWGTFSLKRFPLNPDRPHDTGLLVSRYQPGMVSLLLAMPELPIPPKQKQILMLVTRGLSSKQVSRHLRISPNTVAYHIKQLFQRFKVSDRIQLVQAAREAIREKAGAISP